MLVLSRKIGEEIVVGRNVLIRVLEIHGKRVRVGISAPNAVTVHREEVQQRIDEEVTSLQSIETERHDPNANEEAA